MALTKIYLIPLAFLFLMPITLIVTYSLAVGLGHVSPFLPYISDTGTFSPESCLFGQALNVIALLNFLFVWVRYTHIKTIVDTDISFSIVLCLNKVAYWLGISASLGASMVANFQETNILALHGIGALMLFVPGLIYVWIHAYISIQVVTLIAGVNWLAMFRLALAVVGTLLTILGFVTTPMSLLLFHGKDIHHWQPEDGGYLFHLLSTGSEWLQVLGYAVFVGTFIGEFGSIHIDTIEVVPNNEKLTANSKCALLAGSDSNLEAGGD